MADYLELVGCQHVLLLAGMCDYPRRRKADCYLVQTGWQHCYCHTARFRDGLDCVAIYLNPQ